MRVATAIVLACFINVAAVFSATANSRAVYQYQCDIDGLIGSMTLEIEPILEAGRSWSPGPYPEIARTLADGDVTLLTRGEIVSEEVYYVFSGRNLEADMTLLRTAERFAARFEEGPNGRMRVVVDPRGSDPKQYFCAVNPDG